MDYVSTKSRQNIRKGHRMAPRNSPTTVFYGNTTSKVKSEQAVL